MPTKVTLAEPANDAASQSSRVTSSWWTKLHFSGRVIMCSILFGFGLILIGGILLAINTNDDSPPSGEKGYPDEIPTKPPSNIVGPVVMGIGGFIAIVGVMMCLFETQVCQKKSSENRALINEATTSDVESNLSRSPREDQAKPTSSHKRKGCHGKCRRSKKSSTLKSVAVPIASSRNALTSSGEAFLTPPSTFGGNQELQFNSPIESENQALESPNNYSSGQWSRSSEFQTPCASFKDNSMSLSSSTEIGSLNNDGICDSEFLRPAKKSNFLAQETQVENWTQELTLKSPEQKEQSKIETSDKDYSTTRNITSTEIINPNNDGIHASEPLIPAEIKSNFLTQDTLVENKTQELTQKPPEQKEKSEFETPDKEHSTILDSNTEIKDASHDKSDPESQRVTEQATSVANVASEDDKALDGSSQILEREDESHRYEFLTHACDSVQEDSAPIADGAENDASNEINHMEFQASS